MSNDRDLELTALCTPLLDAPAALEVLTDKLLEEGEISFDDPPGVNPPEASKYRALEASLAWARSRRGFHEKTPYLDQEGEYHVCVTDIRRVDPRISRLPTRTFLNSFALIHDDLRTKELKASSLSGTKVASWKGSPDFVSRISIFSMKSSGVRRDRLSAKTLGAPISSSKWIGNFRWAR